MKIKLHIERMVMEGLPLDRTQSGRVRAAVEGELTRLLATGGVALEFSAGGAVTALRGGVVRIKKSSSPRAMGKEIAAALHYGIGRRR